MTQYRIKELNGEFTIEGSYRIVNTWFFKKKTTILWSRLNIYNHAIGSRNMVLGRNPPPIPPPLKEFGSLISAKTYIDKKILKTQPLEDGIDKPIYHNVGKPFGGSFYKTVG